MNGFTPEYVNLDYLISNVPKEIVEFIVNNYDCLCDFANNKIDGFEFFDIIEAYKEKVLPNSNATVSEMTNSPNKTELPVWVYIDDTNTYLNSEHNGSYRMKFDLYG